MEDHAKKYRIVLYYGGLLTGILAMNYIIKEYKDIALSLMEQFQGLDKLEDVKEKELLFYLLLKRGKQLLLCSYLYFYMAKKLVLYALDFYFAFTIGAVMTLYVHYEGFIGLVHVILLFLPIVIFYGCIYYMAWLQVFENSYVGINAGRKKRILVLLFFGMGIIAETAISYLVR